MVITKATSKYQVLIPKVIRTKIPLVPNQRFSIQIENGKITLIPLPSSLDEIVGCASETFKKLGGGKKYLLNERKRWDK